MAATRGSSAWRKQHWGPGCDASQIIAGPWILGAGNIQCHAVAMPAMRALGRIFRAHRYVVRSSVTGGYNCRKITGGTALSSHSWGTSIDVNWDTNPYRKDKLVTDMPRAMIEAGEALATDAGVIVFRWGGDWDGRPQTPHSNYDGMHWEIIATPAELKAGFSIPAFDIHNADSYPLLALGEKGEAVKQLQELLGSLKVDGDFGAKTVVRLKEYQESRKLKADGWVGLATWTALLTAQPIQKVPPGKSQQPCP